jgi:YD repeat-containing protein
MLILLLVAACGGAAAGPTATPTPACALECDVDTEGYSIGISCESGPVTVAHEGESTEYEYDASGQRTGILVSIDRERTYENSQNTYDIVGTIEVDLIQDTADYEIVVTGGAFGDTPQTCEP